jgi:hypothetical protein
MQRNEERERRMTANFTVTNFEVTWVNENLGPYEKGLDVEWLEKDNAVRYTTKELNIKASVEVSSNDWEGTHEIGFIQACTSNFQCNYYTSGATQRWEFDGIPLLPNGYMNGAVNDSDADDHTPWYNYGSARKMFYFPSSQVITVEMNDNFSPMVGWTEADIPTSYLYRIFRDQYFYNWLAVHKVQSPEYKILGFVGWKIPVDIQFNRDASNKPIHSSWVDQSLASDIWRPSTQIPPIKPEAFKKPRANVAQALYRYPANGSAKQKLPT